MANDRWQDRDHPRDLRHGDDPYRRQDRQDEFGRGESHHGEDWRNRGSWGSQRDPWGGDSEHGRHDRDQQRRGGEAYGRDHGGSDWQRHQRDYNPYNPGQHYRDERSGYGESGSESGSGMYRRPGDGEHRGKGPKGYKRSDERIREQVCDCLTDDPHLDASQIDVQVKEGEVTLAGNVRSRECKRQAENLADGISGVSHVQNNLRVAAQGTFDQAGDPAAMKPRA